MLSPWCPRPPPASSCDEELPGGCGVGSVAGRPEQQLEGVRRGRGALARLPLSHRLRPPREFPARWLWPRGHSVSFPCWGIPGVLRLRCGLRPVSRGSGSPGLLPWPCPPSAGHCLVEGGGQRALPGSLAAWAWGVIWGLAEIDPAAELWRWEWAEATPCVCVTTQPRSCRGAGAALAEGLGPSAWERWLLWAPLSSVSLK